MLLLRKQNFLLKTISLLILAAYLIVSECKCNLNVKVKSKKNKMKEKLILPLSHNNCNI